jgi:hypothetical protein
MSLASAIDASVRRKLLYLELLKVHAVADKILGNLLKFIR